MARKTERRNVGRQHVSRRTLLKGVGASLAAAGVMPWTGRRAQAAAGKVIVRTGGGAYEDALRKAIFEPFKAETGIEVV